MMILISGGSGSGKSELAENLAVKISNSQNLIYIATMKPFGTETLKKIEKHKILRANKNFSTMEVYQDLKNVKVKSNDTILLECMSNLLANETFCDNPSDNISQKIFKGVEHLKTSCENLVVVSNEIFSDSCNYDSETLKYIKDLGNINQNIANISDIVIECIYSNPIIYKGSELFKLL